MDIKEQIVEILLKCEMTEKEVHDDNFIEHEVLDSMQIAEIIMEIEDTFSIEIDGDDIVPDNFVNIESIAALVKKTKAKVSGGSDKTKDGIVWDMVASNSTDAISQSGWKSSFTGNTFSKQEMQEFVENVYIKLADLITPGSHIMELGIGSGLIAERIAPLCEQYVGVDISSETLERTKIRLEKEGLNNISYVQGDIRNIKAVTGFSSDIVIINSVMQYLNNELEFESIIKDITDEITPAFIFVGDILDKEKKKEFVNNVQKVGGRANKSDLWYDKNFMEQIGLKNDRIKDTKISGKVGFSINNELTEYRYDVLYSLENK